MSGDLITKLHELRRRIPKFSSFFHRLVGGYGPHRATDILLSYLGSPTPSVRLHLRRLKYGRLPPSDFLNGKTNLPNNHEGSLPHSPKAFLEHRVQVFDALRNRELGKNAHSKPVNGRNEDIISPIPWNPEAGWFLPKDYLFKTDPLYILSSLYYSQSASSHMIDTALYSDFIVDPSNQSSKHPLRVVDMCSAPGGKAISLCSGLPPHSLLICTDMPDRAGKLFEVLERWNDRPNVIAIATPAQTLAEPLPNASSTSLASPASPSSSTPLHPGIVSRGADYSHTDGLSRNSQNTNSTRPSPFLHYFDIAVLDAPCSGSGMFRKASAPAEAWSPALITKRSNDQRQLFDAAFSLVNPHSHVDQASSLENTCPPSSDTTAPAHTTADGVGVMTGGRILYMTCSIDPVENQGLVAYVYRKYNQVKLSPARRLLLPSSGASSSSGSVPDSPNMTVTRQNLEKKGESICLWTASLADANDREESVERGKEKQNTPPEEVMVENSKSKGKVGKKNKESAKEATSGSNPGLRAILNVIREENPKLYKQKDVLSELSAERVSIIPGARVYVPPPPLPSLPSVTHSSLSLPPLSPLPSQPSPVSTSPPPLHPPVALMAVTECVELTPLCLPLFHAYADRWGLIETPMAGYNRETKEDIIHPSWLALPSHCSSEGFYLSGFRVQADQRPLSPSSPSSSSSSHPSSPGRPSVDSHFSLSPSSSSSSSSSPFSSFPTSSSSQHTLFLSDPASSLGPYLRLPPSLTNLLFHSWLDEAAFNGQRSASSHNDSFPSDGPISLFMLPQETTDDQVATATLIGISYEHEHVLSWVSDLSLHSTPKQRQTRPYPHHRAGIVLGTLSFSIDLRYGSLWNEFVRNYTGSSIQMLRNQSRKVPTGHVAETSHQRGTHRHHDVDVPQQLGRIDLANACFEPSHQLALNGSVYLHPTRKTRHIPLSELSARSLLTSDGVIPTPMMNTDTESSEDVGSLLNVDGAYTQGILPAQLPMGSKGNSYNSPRSSGASGSSPHRFIPLTNKVADTANPLTPLSTPPISPGEYVLLSLRGYPLGWAQVVQNTQSPSFPSSRMRGADVKQTGRDNSRSLDSISKSIEGGAIWRHILGDCSLQAALTIPSPRFDNFSLVKSNKHTALISSAADDDVDVDDDT